MRPQARIVAAGKGKSMNFPAIVDAVLSALPKQAKRKSRIHLVYLGTASYDRMPAFYAQTNSFRQVSNLDITKLDVSEAAEEMPTLSQVQSIIASADILLFSGGNTLSAIRRFQSLGIDRMIADAVNKNDVVLCGGSAGGVLWFDFAHSDSMNPASWLQIDENLTQEQLKNWDYVRVAGLGYIPALVVPHYNAVASNGRPRCKDSDRMLLQYPEQPMLGIDEEAALVSIDGQLSVVSGDGKAQCYVKRLVNGQVLSQPFTPRHGRLAMEKVLRGDL